MLNPTYKNHRLQPVGWVELILAKPNYNFFMRYRRTRVPGASYFFTVVTFQRNPIFAEDRNVDMLRAAVQNTIQRHPFQVNAAVILPDHLHMIWTLPPEDSDYSSRWRLIKSFYSRNRLDTDDHPAPASRAAKGEQAVWQRRFWEHLIRDEADFLRHVEYIHYNPVKHRLVDSPGAWKHTSFHQFVKEGLYSADWGAQGEFQSGLEIGWE